MIRGIKFVAIPVRDQDVQAPVDQGPEIRLPGRRGAATP